MSRRSHQEIHGDFSFERRFSMADMGKIIVAIFIAGVFYNQIGENQKKNDDKFQQYATARDIQAVQMQKLQETQTTLTLQFTTFATDTTAALRAQVEALRDMKQSQNDMSKDIREILTPKAH